MPFAPPYNDEAARLVATVKKIIEAAKKTGTGTNLIMVVLTEVLTWAAEAPAFLKMTKAEKEAFFAEVFDQAIGSEPGALVTQVAFVGGPALEALTDSIKEIFLAYLAATAPKVLTA